MYSPHLRSFAISIFALIEYEYTGISLVCSKNMSKKTMKPCVLMLMCKVIMRFEVELILQIGTNVNGLSCRGCPFMKEC